MDGGESRKKEKRKPEGVTSGFAKVSANSRKQNQIVSLFYYIFPINTINGWILNFPPKNSNQVLY
jgi:hypothetical protein